jgi:8-oxo-dGTP pyrophosphatase MutT (NUDIX family)
VLIALYVHESRTSVILTRRAAHLRTHSREVSFPGGGHEPDDTDLWETACREAHEEIGLDPASVVRIGELDPFFTVGSDSLVFPYVAELPDGHPSGLRPDPAEVEKILHVPLCDLLDPDAYRQELWPRDGALRPINFFEIPGDTIWGATAAILRQLLLLATGSQSARSARRAGHAP